MGLHRAFACFTSTITQPKRDSRETLADARETIDVISETALDDSLARFRDPETTINCVVSDYATPSAPPIWTCRSCSLPAAEARGSRAERSRRV